MGRQGRVENEKSYKLFLSHPKLIVIHKTKDFLQNRYFDFGFALYLIWKNSIFAPILTILIDFQIFWSIMVKLFIKSDDYTQNSGSLCFEIQIYYTFSSTISSKQYFYCDRTTKNLYGPLFLSILFSYGLNWSNKSHFYQFWYKNKHQTLVFWILNIQ